MELEEVSDIEITEMDASNEVGDIEADMDDFPEEWMVLDDADDKDPTESDSPLKPEKWSSSERSEKDVVTESKQSSAISKPLNPKQTSQQGTKAKVATSHQAEEGAGTPRQAGTSAATSKSKVATPATPKTAKKASTEEPEMATTTTPKTEKKATAKPVVATPAALKTTTKASTEELEMPTATTPKTDKEASAKPVVAMPAAPKSAAAKTATSKPMVTRSATPKSAGKVPTNSRSEETAAPALKSALVSDSPKVQETAATSKLLAARQKIIEGKDKASTSIDKAPTSGTVKATTTTAISKSALAKTVTPGMVELEVTEASLKSAEASSRSTEESSKSTEIGESTLKTGTAAATTKSIQAASTPKSTQAASTPKSTQAASTPKSKEAASTPKSTQAASTPKSEEAASTPKSTQAASTPKSTQAASTPKSTQAASTPKSTQAASTPKSEEAASTPKSTQAASTPKSTQAASTPKSTQAASTSKSTQAASTPKSTQAASTPKSTQAASTPKSTQAASTPKSEEAASTPKSTQAASTPKSEEAASTPKSTQAASTPKSTQAASTPKSTQAASTPKSTQAASTPKSTQAASTPKSAQAGAKKGAVIPKPSVAAPCEPAVSAPVSAVAASKQATSTKQGTGTSDQKSTDIQKQSFGQNAPSHQKPVSQAKAKLVESKVVDSIPVQAESSKPDHEKLIKSKSLVQAQNPVEIKSASQSAGTTRSAAQAKPKAQTSSSTQAKPETPQLRTRSQSVVSITPTPTADTGKQDSQLHIRGKSPVQHKSDSKAEGGVEASAGSVPNEKKGSASKETVGKSETPEVVPASATVLHPSDYGRKKTEPAAQVPGTSVCSTHNAGRSGGEDKVEKGVISKKNASAAFDSKEEMDVDGQVPPEGGLKGQTYVHPADTKDSLKSSSCTVEISKSQSAKCEQRLQSDAEMIDSNPKKQETTEPPGSKTLSPSDILSHQSGGHNNSNKESSKDRLDEKGLGGSSSTARGSSTTSRGPGSTTRGPGSSTRNSSQEEEKHKAGSRASQSENLDNKSRGRSRSPRRGRSQQDESKVPEQKYNGREDRQGTSSLENKQDDKRRDKETSKTGRESLPFAKKSSLFSKSDTDVCKDGMTAKKSDQGSGKPTDNSAKIGKSSSEGDTSKSPDVSRRQSSSGRGEKGKEAAEPQNTVLPASEIKKMEEEFVTKFLDLRSNAMEQGLWRFAVQISPLDFADLGQEPVQTFLNGAQDCAIYMRSHIKAKKKKGEARMFFPRLQAAKLAMEKVFQLSLVNKKVDLEITRKLLDSSKKDTILISLDLTDVEALSQKTTAVKGAAKVKVMDLGYLVRGADRSSTADDKNVHVSSVPKGTTQELLLLTFPTSHAIRMPREGSDTGSVVIECNNANHARDIVRCYVSVSINKTKLRLIWNGLSREKLPIPSPKKAADEAVFQIPLRDSWRGGKSESRDHHESRVAGSGAGDAVGTTMAESKTKECISSQELPSSQSSEIVRTLPPNFQESKIAGTPERMSRPSDVSSKVRSDFDRTAEQEEGQDTRHGEADFVEGTEAISPDWEREHPDRESISPEWDDNPDKEDSDGQKPTIENQQTARSDLRPAGFKQRGGRGARNPGRGNGRLVRNIVSDKGPRREPRDLDYSSRILSDAARGFSKGSSGKRTREEEDYSRSRSTDQRVDTSVVPRSQRHASPLRSTQRQSGSPRHSPKRVCRSPSPRLRRTPSPKLRRSPRPRRSSSPRLRRSPNPRLRRSPSPRLRRSPNQRLRKSPNLRPRRSPSPRLRRSPNPSLRRSPNLRPRRSPSPRLRRSLSPPRRQAGNIVSSISPTRGLSGRLKSMSPPGRQRAPITFSAEKNIKDVKILAEILLKNLSPSTPSQSQKEQQSWNSGHLAGFQRAGWNPASSGDQQSALQTLSTSASLASLFPAGLTSASHPADIKGFMPSSLSASLSAMTSLQNTPSYGQAGAEDARLKRADIFSKQWQALTRPEEKLASVMAGGSFETLREGGLCGADSEALKQKHDTQNPGLGNLFGARDEPLFTSKYATDPQKTTRANKLENVQPWVLSDQMQTTAVTETPCDTSLKAGLSSKSLGGRDLMTLRQEAARHLASVEKSTGGVKEDETRQDSRGSSRTETAGSAVVMDYGHQSRKRKAEQKPMAASSKRNRDGGFEEDVIFMGAQEPMAGRSKQPQQNVGGPWKKDEDRAGANTLQMLWKVMGGGSEGPGLGSLPGRGSDGLGLGPPPSGQRFEGQSQGGPPGKMLDASGLGPPPVRGFDGHGLGPAPGRVFEGTGFGVPSGQRTEGPGFQLMAGRGPDGAGLLLPSNRGPEGAGAGPQAGRGIDQSALGARSGQGLQGPGFPPMSGRGPDGFMQSAQVGRDSNRQGQVPLPWQGLGLGPDGAQLGLSQGRVPAGSGLGNPPWQGQDGAEVGHGQVRGIQGSKSFAGRNLDRPGPGVQNRVMDMKHNAAGFNKGGYSGLPQMSGGGPGLGGGPGMGPEKRDWGQNKPLGLLWDQGGGQGKLAEGGAKHWDNQNRDEGWERGQEGGWHNNRGIGSVPPRPHQGQATTAWMAPPPTPPMQLSRQPGKGSTLQPFYPGPV